MRDSRAAGRNRECRMRGIVSGGPSPAFHRRFTPSSDLDIIHLVRFASDSPLEEDGFEPSVPPQKTAFFETAPNPATTNRPGSQRRF